MQPADLLTLYERFVFVRTNFVTGKTLFSGGRYRIRTHVIGLEGRYDIQTTPIARGLTRKYLFDEPYTSNVFLEETVYSVF